MQLLTKQTSGPHYQVHIRLYKLPSKNYTLWLVALIYPKAGVINETLYFAKAPVRETVGGQSVEIQYCHRLKPDLQRGLEVVAADAAASRILAANQIEENNPATCASNADRTSLPGTEVISNVYRFVAAP